MARYIDKALKKILRLFIAKVSIDYETYNFGSTYGGWKIIKKRYDKEITLISAGVGEDISFDIEILNKFNSTIYFVDPTPKALNHLDLVIKNLGINSTIPYESSSGRQPIESYNLKNISKESIKVIAKALYNTHNKTVKFYLPPNADHVSHSISNFQNNFDKSTEYIEVETTTISQIMKINNLKKVDILKLDIEGAENQVLPHILKSKIFPDQVLVEFDELRTSNTASAFSALKIFLKLHFFGYRLININKYPNFLFVRNMLINK